MIPLSTHLQLGILLPGLTFALPPCVFCSWPRLLGNTKEYEKLKADARARASGQRDEMADMERQIASANSTLDQLRSQKVRINFCVQPVFHALCQRHGI